MVWSRVTVSSFKISRGYDTQSLQYKKILQDSLLDDFEMQILGSKLFVGHRDLAGFLDKAYFVFPLVLCVELSSVVLDLKSPFLEPMFAIGRPPSYIQTRVKKCSGLGPPRNFLLLQSVIF
jgi:hypothetical protein